MDYNARISMFSSRPSTLDLQTSLSHFTPICQLILSFCGGIFFSCWNLSLVVVLFFLVLYELFYDCLVHQRPKWQYQLRIGVILAYLMGWIIGRTVLGLEISFLSPEDDGERLGRHCLCKRRIARNSNRK